MSSCNAERSRMWIACAAMSFALLLLAVGCSSSHHCAGPETCNGKDDDCDGRADEDFRDARGRYVSEDHCGRCGVSCTEAFPTARETTCDTEPATPMCRLVSCPPGFHVVDESTCVRNQAVQCLPCERDSDCSDRLAGARCLVAAGEQRCAIPCDGVGSCPSPFACDVAQGLCVPDSGFCACHGVSDTFEVACLGEGSVSGLVCAGVQTCSPDGLGECVIASVESCNGKDDDCDGEVDEDFVDASGRYVSRLHCGACNLPCVPPGQNYEATCTAAAASARCDVSCAPGFVDVDHVRGNGCECQLFDGTTAPVVVGGDANCDGIVDDDSTFVHVTPGGSDTAPGTLVRPMRTIRAAITRAAAENKAVVVAQGTYAPFQIVAGARVFGGYRSDFRDRDPELYPVSVEHPSFADGAPVLTCKGVHATALIDGLTFVGEDAETAGRGSTALAFEDCGPEVKLTHSTVFAGRGADGQVGPAASERLPSGIHSLAELNGRDAQSGRPGDPAGTDCVTVAGGGGGAKLCGTRDVSGGAGGAGACPDLGCTNGEPCANAGCTDFTTGNTCDYAAVLASAVPNPPASAGRGTTPGKAGTSTYNAPTNRGACEFCDDNPTLPRVGADGTDGANGAPGNGGNGCNASALIVDAQGRASAATGTAGTAGADGSGGGGGSAGNGFSVIGGTSGSCDDSAGGSGGGGGSGGCGSPSGGGGGGGGASLAVFVRATSQGDGPTFDAVRVITASGGRGGDGGIGAAGGAGGKGAPGGLSRFWCSRSGGRGGNGGNGGAGGGGGGGCGGASHALLLLGSPSASYRNDAEQALSVELAGVPGQGGRGGFSPSDGGGAGAAGNNSSVRVQ